jgi:soluble lytic murein transglycosylase
MPALAQSDAIGEAAVRAAARRDWAEAGRLALETGDPVAAKMVAWLSVSGTDAAASFEEVARFIDANPDWPLKRTLERRAEAAINDQTPGAALLAWFDRHPPVTAKGHYAYSANLMADGREPQAREVARRGWREEAFETVAEESLFLRSFGAFLEPDDHRGRMDTMLLKGETAAVARTLERLDGGWQALGRARLLLRQGEIGPSAARGMVPDDLRSDPGLAYELARIHRRNDEDDEAAQALLAVDSPGPWGERLWDERLIVARRLLARGDDRLAYRVAAGHGMSSGTDFLDGEWHAGWIALRFRDDPATALSHFQRMYAGAQTPISRGRGGYWVGRAYAAKGDGQGARMWYAVAAQNPTAFYGQLAASDIAPGGILRLPEDPAASVEERAAFERHDLVQAIGLLDGNGADQHLRAFFLALADVRTSAAWKALATSLADRIGRPDIAVAIAKQSIRQGLHAGPGAYPLLPVPEPRAYAPVPLESPLVLSVVRQESAFDRTAVSPAGALGLMQLMPGTARAMAQEINVAYSGPGLTRNPSYNLELGQAYLGKMLGQFGGSYVLALSAYNAGPARARQWLAQHGDPRQGVIEAIDWVERIPFSETRNYVQRILEALQVYRIRLNGGEAANRIDGDLVR